MLENENPLIQPEEVKRRRSESLEVVKQNLVNKLNEGMIPKELLPTVESINEERYVNKGQTVKITFESAGRFGNHKEVWFKDYTTKHINDLVTTQEDDMLETMIAILQECIVEPINFQIDNCTNEDLFEIMMAMKISFDSSVLKYKWYHKCQDDIQDEKERQVSEYLIDLTKAEYKPIEDLDKELQDYYRDMFKKLSPEQYQNYVDAKFGVGKQVSIDEAVSGIKIQDPFYIPSIGDDIAVFEYIKIKHMMKASKRANEEWNSKIRYAQSRKYKGSVQEQKSERDNEVEQIKRKKARSVIGYAQALCLNGIKNKQTGEVSYFKTDLDKIEAYKNLPKNVMFGFINALEKIKFGINYDIEIECDLCQVDNKERRLLQRDISFIELFPFANDSTNSTTRKPQQSASFMFYF